MLLWLFPVVLALDPAKVKYAVNCGGPELTTHDSVTYLADTGYSAGVESDYGKGFPIKLTKTPELYQTERYAEGDLSYTIPLTEPGSYVLILKFSEIWFNNEQEKIFNVKIGDVTVVSLLDIFSHVGKYAAYDEFVQFNFESGKVLINNKEAKGALKNGKLKVDFIKTDFDNPKVNAIVLLKGGIEDTNFAEQKKFIESMRRQQKEEQAKREELANKGYKADKVYEDEGDFEEVFTDEHHIVIEESQSLLHVLSSIPALIIISLILVLGVAACIPSKPSAKPQPVSDKAKRS